MSNLNVKPNALFTADNLYVLNGMNDECVDLIYLDPPFNSKRLYKAPVGSKAAGAAFDDMWTWKDVDEALMVKLSETHPHLVDYITNIGHIHSKGMMAYIAYMAQRLLELHRVLKPTGSIYLHCDSTASHYLKVVMDRIFGMKNFRQEIIWYRYNKIDDKRKVWCKYHDTILCYSKSPDMVWNKLTIGTGKMVTRKKIKKMNGKITSTGEYITYERQKCLTRSVIDNIPDIAIGSSKQKTGYPTQKPLDLLHRIIKTSSNEGDVVLDPFCGCATACVAAQQLDRKWIGIDISKTTKDMIRSRLANAVGTLFDDFVPFKAPPIRDDVKRMTKKEAKPILYGEQEGHCAGCKEHFEARHLEVDHYIPKSKGGGDFHSNFQLLCGNCNRIKGNRPMEYLLVVIEARRAKRAVFGRRVE